MNGFVDIDQRVWEERENKKQQWAKDLEKQMEERKQRKEELKRVKAEEDARNEQKLNRDLKELSQWQEEERKKEDAKEENRRLAAQQFEIELQKKLEREAEREMKLRRLQDKQAEKAFDQTVREGPITTGEVTIVDKNESRNNQLRSKPTESPFIPSSTPVSVVSEANDGLISGQVEILKGTLGNEMSSIQQ